MPNNGLIEVKTIMPNDEGIEVKVKYVDGKEEILESVSRITCDSENISFETPSLETKCTYVPRGEVGEFEAKMSHETKGMLGIINGLRLRNVTEVHYNYPLSILGERIAFESDIHYTGATYPISNFEVSLEEEKADYFY